MENIKKPRGFAAISPERRKEISSLGGKAAHAAGTAHKYTPEEAQAAGRKGGLAPHKRRGRQAIPVVTAEAEEQPPQSKAA